VSVARKSAGFTLLELLVVMAIAALVVGTSVPYAQKMYQSMQYRSAVKDTMIMLMSARHLATSTSETVDVYIIPRRNEIKLAAQERNFSEFINITATTAAEFNKEDEGIAVIRFYADGSSSGGTISIENIGLRATRLKVDWFLGKISQELYEPI